MDSGQALYEEWCSHVVSTVPWDDLSEEHQAAWNELQDAVSDWYY